MDVKHTLNGLRCTIDSAFAATSTEVWVDAEDLPRALRTINKLNGQKFSHPEVYTSQEADSAASESVCIVLE